MKLQQWGDCKFDHFYAMMLKYIQMRIVIANIPKLFKELKAPFFLTFVKYNLKTFYKKALKIVFLKK
jgi:hypothetical protein